MIATIRASVVLLVVFTLLTGVAYPLAVTGLAQAVFANQANGSLIHNEKGDVVGSDLIDQSFEDPGHFWGRLSATSPFAYNAGLSTGSNLGPTNSAEKDAVSARVDKLHDADKTNADAIPVDLVTASGSGLDPHISPAAAYYQVNRVAKARNLPSDKVRSLVDSSIEGRTLFVLGEPVVNVLRLNRALDALAK